jgi:hypothetical protein
MPIRSGEWTASSAASQPPSEPPDDVHALEAEAVEDVEVVVDEVVHRLDLVQFVGAPEARMVGRHHREAAGQEPEEGMPRAGTASRVEEEQRRTLAAALDVDRAAAELEPLARARGQRAGRVGHGGSVSPHPSGSRMCVRLLDVAVGVPLRCAGDHLRTSVRCANACRS